ncbi:hypothetical protein [Candidatus Phytoplasma pyri]|uniref:hypothetical protein n=1 Tax=Candidatus Phytoplasma pyri TaxID=47566 RepID=UPI0039835FC2
MLHKQIINYIMKQRKKNFQLIKNMVAFFTLSFIFLFVFIEGEHSNFIENKMNKIIYVILFFISFLILIGLFSYIGFKTTRGTTFIYKVPNKEKKLNNIDFGQSFPNIRKYSNYKKENKYSK